MDNQLNDCNDSHLNSNINFTKVGLDGTDGFSERNRWNNIEGNNFENDENGLDWLYDTQAYPNGHCYGDEMFNTYFPKVSSSPPNTPQSIAPSNSATVVQINSMAGSIPYSISPLPTPTSSSYTSCSTSCHQNDQIYQYDSSYLNMTASSNDRTYLNSKTSPKYYDLKTSKEEYNALNESHTIHLQSYPSQTNIITNETNYPGPPILPKPPAPAKLSEYYYPTQANSTYSWNSAEFKNNQPLDLSQRPLLPGYLHYSNTSNFGYSNASVMRYGPDVMQRQVPQMQPIRPVSTHNSVRVNQGGREYIILPPITARFVNYPSQVVNHTNTCRLSPIVPNRPECPNLAPVVSNVYTPVCMDKRGNNALVVSMVPWPTNRIVMPDNNRKTKGKNKNADCSSNLTEARNIVPFNRVMACATRRETRPKHFDVEQFRIGSFQVDSSINNRQTYTTQLKVIFSKKRFIYEFPYLNSECSFKSSNGNPVIFYAMLVPFGTITGLNIVGSTIYMVVNRMPRIFGGSTSKSRITFEKVPNLDPSHGEIRNNALHIIHIRQNQIDRLKSCLVEFDIVFKRLLEIEVDPNPRCHIRELANNIEEDDNESLVKEKSPDALVLKSGKRKRVEYNQSEHDLIDP